jgi:hypothetical protein
MKEKPSSQVQKVKANILMSTSEILLPSLVINLKVGSGILFL